YIVIYLQLLGSSTVTVGLQRTSPWRSEGRILGGDRESEGPADAESRRHRSLGLAGGAGAEPGSGRSRGRALLWAEPGSGRSRGGGWGWGARGWVFVICFRREGGARPPPEPLRPGVSSDRARQPPSLQAADRPARRRPRPDRPHPRDRRPPGGRVRWGRGR